MSENEQKQDLSKALVPWPMVERTLKALADSFSEPWWRREKELIKTIERLEEELSTAQEVPNDLGELLRAEKERVFELKETLAAVENRRKDAWAALEQEKTISFGRLDDLKKTHAHVEELKIQIRNARAAGDRYKKQRDEAWSAKSAFAKLFEEKKEHLSRALSQVVELEHQLEESNTDLEKARARLDRSVKKAARHERVLNERLREEKTQREAYEDWITFEDAWDEFNEWFEQAKEEEGVEVVKLGPPPCKERDAKGQRCIYLDGHGGDCDGGKPTNPCHSNYGVQWRQGKGGGEWICVRCDKVIEKAEEK